MKKYNISSKVAGALLFALASIFSFALLVHLFGFAGRGSFTLKFLYGMGKILSGAYGFCSVLIPLFFFAASMTAFSGHRTFKKCVYISFSLIPFFTAVAIEKVYRALTAGYVGLSSFKVVQLVLAFVIGLLVIVIEYLLAGIVAERIFYGVEEVQTDKRIDSLDQEFGPMDSGEEEEVLDESAEEDISVEKTFEEESAPEDNFVKTEDLAPAKEILSELDKKYLHEFDDLKLTGIKIPEKFLPKEEKKEEVQEKVEGKVPPRAPLEAALNTYETKTEEIAQAAVLEKKVEEPQAQVEPEPVAPTVPAAPAEPIVISRQTMSAVEEVPVEKTVTTDGIEVDEDEYDADDYPNYVEDEDEQESGEGFNALEDYSAEEDADETVQEEIQEEVESEGEPLEEEAQEEIQEGAIEEDSDFDIAVDDAEADEAGAEEESAVEDEEYKVDVTPEEEDKEPVSINDEKTLTAVNPRLQEKAAPKVEEKPLPPPEPKIIDSRFTRGVYKIPTERILNEFENSDYWVIDEGTNASAAQLKETLEEFKISAEVTGIRKGPVVTMFEILPAPGVKLSKIVTLQDNIALRLAAKSVRIVAPIPGKRAVGIEVPNKERAVVAFREIIEQDIPEFKKMAVPVILGKDIQGEAQVIDLSKTPHLLIAGSTGSGKSVCVNSLILSILYKRSPEQVKMILVDPKIVELKLYNDIPHLLTPVITEPKKALQSLQYCLCEMERRYALLDGMGVRDIISYNKRIEERHIATEKLPYIVVIIDEFADLMATTGKELESTIARLCAMSRAVGIHLVLATQRPSVDVITGLIKANIPSRIAFAVASKMDSRIIIDQVGAEKLLGRGDMLFVSAVNPVPIRIQGTLISDDEVENVVNYVKQYGFPEYIDDEIFVDDEDEENPEPGLFDEGDDPLYSKALDIVVEAGKASASYIQRRLKIGYNRAARLVEEMEARGIVGPANGSKPREIIHMP